jgi:hypothetical protein
VIALWLFLGALTEALNSFTRWWTVARIRADLQRNALTLTLGGMALRLALVAAVLTAALRQGILPGLLAFVGVWLSRSAAVIWFHTSGSAGWYGGGDGRERATREM